MAEAPLPRIHGHQKKQHTDMVNGSTASVQSGTTHASLVCTTSEAPGPATDPDNGASGKGTQGGGAMTQTHLEAY